MENVELFLGYSDELLNFASVMCIIFILVGIPGNLITILALWKSNKSRNATAICIINLSFSDLLFCCFNLPLAASTFLRRSWNHGAQLCRLFPLMRYGLLAVSLFTILLITTNRYVMIGHPRSYLRIYRNRNLAIMIAATWIGAFLFLIPTYRGIWGAFGLDVQIGSCSILPDKNGNSPKEILFVMAFVVPCFCIVVCYARIFYIVRKAALKSRDPINMSSSQRIEKNEAFKEINHLGQQLNENHCLVPSKNDKQSSSSNSNICTSPSESELEKQHHWQMRPYLSKIKADDIKFIDTSIDSDYPSTLHQNQVEGSSEETICCENDANNKNGAVKNYLNTDCKQSYSGYGKDMSENAQVLLYKENAVVTEVPLKENDTSNEPDEKRKRFSSKAIKTSFNRVATRRNRNNSTINNSNTSVLYPGRMSQKDKRLLKMILVIFLSFVICYLPITITKIWKEVTKLHWLNISGYLLIYLTTCINPIIYVVMSSEYRQAYWNLLLCKNEKSTKNRRPSGVTKRTSNVKAQL